MVTRTKVEVAGVGGGGQSRNVPEAGGWHWAQLPGKKLLESESESFRLPHILAQGRCVILQVSEASPCLPGASPGALLPAPPPPSGGLGDSGGTGEGRLQAAAK